jgi:uncharacterized protein (TIGR00730 family)
MEKTSSRRITNICVFCGSSSGNTPEFMKAAKELGRVMAERKMHLVYGGGNLGLMGCISKAVQDGGRQVLGIIPKTLADESIIGKTNGEIYIVSGMSERITEMINHADAFIALPGGLGTLEEIFTVTSWANLYIHRKPIGLLNVNHFFDFLLVFLENAKMLGLLSKSAKDIVFTSRKADELIDQLVAYEPKIDPLLSKLDWSDNDRGKKRRVDLNLSL